MSTSERFKLISEVSLLLERDGKILLMRRCNTGYEDGNYAMPAGHKEAAESLRAAMCREAKEELGIVIRPEDLEFLHVMHRLGHDERLSFYFKATAWTGEVENKEPDKCDDLAWFEVSALPQNIVAFQKESLERHLHGEVFSEKGF